MRELFCPSFDHKICGRMVDDHEIRSGMREHGPAFALNDDVRGEHLDDEARIRITSSTFCWDRGSRDLETFS